MDVDGREQRDRAARSLWDHWFTRWGKRTGEAGQCIKLERWQWPPLALRGLWHRFHRRFRLSERPLGIQSFDERMDMDEREQHGALRWLRSSCSVWRGGNACGGKRPRRQEPGGELDRQQRQFLAS